MVCMLPVLAANDGIGDPFFANIIRHSDPAFLVNPSIRAALGKLFPWKLSIFVDDHRAERAVFQTVL